jgi:hypothetical protein
MNAIKEVKMPLGDAIVRHNNLHKRITAGIASPVDRKEYGMISTALNSIELSLGFDCDGDGIPDTVDIFTQSAATSCCRLPVLPKGKKTKKSKSSSRSPIKKR